MDDSVERLSEEVWRFEEWLSEHPEGVIWDWYFGSGRADPSPAWFIELCRCGATAHPTATQWLERHWVDPRFQVLSDEERIALLKNIYEDLIVAEQAVSWASFAAFGFSPERLQLRGVDDRFSLGEVVAGSWRLIARVGMGGFGVVYQGESLADGSLAALKVPRADSAESRVDYGRELRAESDRLQALTLEGVPRWFDLIESDMGPVLVMEFIPGVNLQTRLRTGPLEHDAALKLAAQIARTLDEAHRRGWLHGDLKPLNILLRENGRPILTDFNAARSANPLDHVDGRQTGTLANMSAEALVGVAADVDVRQDVWALGALLYTALTGKSLSNPESSEAALVGAILRGGSHPVEFPESTPASVQHIVHRAIARRPLARYETAGDFARACEAAFAATGGDPDQGLTRHALTAWRCGSELARLFRYHDQIQRLVKRMETDSPPTPRDLAYGQLSAVGVAEAFDDVRILTEQLGTPIPEAGLLPAYRKWSYAGLPRKTESREELQSVCASTENWCAATFEQLRSTLGAKRADWEQWLELGFNLELCPDSSLARERLVDCWKMSPLTSSTAATAAFECMTSEDVDLRAAAAELRQACLRFLRWEFDDSAN